MYGRELRGLPGSSRLGGSLLMSKWSPGIGIRPAITRKTAAYADSATTAILAGSGQSKPARFRGYSGESVKVGSFQQLGTISNLDASNPVRYRKHRIRIDSDLRTLHESHASSLAVSVESPVVTARAGDWPAIRLAVTSSLFFFRHSKGLIL
jgi:hypothetical protein